MNEMMDRKEMAAEYKRNGRKNCCQAVLLAYKDKLGLGEEVLHKMGSQLGAGLGDMRGACGALLGAELVEGMLLSNGLPNNKESKALRDNFETKVGAVNCRDIKGVDTGKILCDCNTCCYLAVECLEDAGL